MTISTPASSVTIAGNGATAAFNYSFIAGVAANVVVTYTDANSNATVLVQGAQYTLSINAPAAGQIWGVGGTVTYPLSGAPIASGTYLTIQRLVPFTQLTSISNQGDFYPQAVEQAMDTLEMQIQQVEFQAGRALLFNVADQGPFATLPTAAVRAGKILGFDSSGNPAAFTGLSNGAAVSSSMIPIVEAATIPTALTLLMAPNEASGLLVYQEVFPGVTFTDNIVGHNVLSAGYTVVQVTAIAGYVQSQAATVSGNGNAVALFGCGTAEVNGAAVWGINTLLQDSATRAVGSGTSRILLNEFDFNVMNPATQVIGCSVGGNSLAQPAISSGYIVNSLGTGVKWGGGFITEDGAAVTAVSIGASSASVGPNFASQNFEMSFYDSTSTKQVVQITAGSNPASPEAIVSIAGTVKTSLTLAGGNLNLASGTGAITIGSNQVVGPRITGMGAVTGGAPTAFNATTATLGQTAAAAAWALQVMINHGLIGP